MFRKAAIKLSGLLVKSSYVVSQIRNVRGRWSQKIQWIDRFEDHISHELEPQGNLKANDLVAWWRHQMETFSTSLALCVGNSPVTDDVVMNKRQFVIAKTSGIWNASKHLLGHDKTTIFSDKGCK